MNPKEQFANMSTKELQTRIGEVRAMGKEPSAAALQEMDRRLRVLDYQTWKAFHEERNRIVAWLRGSEARRIALQNVFAVDVPGALADRIVAQWAEGWNEE